MSRHDELVFVPLGGVGEIGMNLALYGYGQGKNRKWLAVDMGVAFGKDDLPGVDAVLPDIGFLLSQKNNLAGIAITHAHEDHFGALFDFWPQLKVPVFMTPFAAGLLAAKQAGEPGAPQIPVRVVAQGGRATIGPFEVEYVPVSHSIPESSSLAIRTPAGLVVHTADWKLDPTPMLGKPTDEARFAALGKEGVLALICDSTNAIRDGISPSEADVAKVIEIIDSSGLPYKTNAMSTIIEGDWEEVMAIINKARLKLKETCNRLYIVIMVDDREGAGNRLEGKVESLETELGKKVRK